jgi:hypothetical protein
VAARLSKKKLPRYSLEFKLSAVRLTKVPVKPVKAPPVRELKRLAALEKEHALLQEEHALPQKAIRFSSERRGMSSPSSRRTGNRSK